LKQPINEPRFLSTFYLHHSPSCLARSRLPLGRQRSEKCGQLQVRECREWAVTPVAAWPSPFVGAGAEMSPAPGRS
jgi:hypothetical protein